nr:hypothetical protein GCM10020092_083980 [Actinoplanes digitatis]
MDLGLADRVYVLTGASKGLGFATARSLVADGAKVVISSRSAESVEAAVAELGDGAAGVAADLTDPATPELLVRTARARFGRLDGALVSVGGPDRGTAAQLTDDQWRGAFETVFLGSVRAMRTFAAELGEGGAIAVVLSTSTRTPIPGLGLSNGLRPGLAGVAKDMADEFGPPRRTGGQPAARAGDDRPQPRALRGHRGRRRRGGRGGRVHSPRATRRAGGVRTGGGVRAVAAGSAT